MDTHGMTLAKVSMLINLKPDNKKDFKLPLVATSREALTQPTHGHRAAASLHGATHLIRTCLASCVGICNGKENENEEGSWRHNHNLPCLVLSMHKVVNLAQDAPWQRNKQPPLGIEPRTFSLQD